MYSRDIMYTDSYPRGGQQASGPELFTIHYNGDYSGDVRINLEGWRVTRIDDPSQQRHGNSVSEVEIPFEVLLKLAAEFVRERLVARLEKLDYRQVLGI